MRPAILIILLATFTQQVDIRMERTFEIAGEAESFIAATCLNLPSGVCCKPPTSIPNVTTTNVLFRHLHALHIAAVWRGGQRFDHGVVTQLTGCSGSMLTSRRGSGRWLWRQSAMPLAERHAAEGASYITMPQNLPPSPKNFDWQSAQGLLGLVWQGGEWFSTPEAERLLGLNAIVTKPKLRRDVRSADQGTVFARSPLREMYPTYIEINGTQWSGFRAGALMYTDNAGNVLNLTGWFTNSGG